MSEPTPQQQRRNAAGGRGRAEKLTPDQRSAIARSGAAAAHDPANLARRIAAAWPSTGRAKRAEVRAILATLAPRPRPSRGER